MCDSQLREDKLWEVLKTVWLLVKTIVIHDEETDIIFDQNPANGFAFSFLPGDVAKVDRHDSSFHSF